MKVEIWYRRKPEPQEGISTCWCGSKYWDKVGVAWYCHSCNDEFRSESEEGK